MFSLEAQAAHKGKAGDVIHCAACVVRQGRNAAASPGVMGWHLLGWWGSQSRADLPVSLLWLFQAAGELPKSFSASCWLCFGSVIAVGSPACRTAPEEVASCGQNRAGTCNKAHGFCCL